MYARGKIQQRLVKMPIYSLATELTLPSPYHEPVSHWWMETGPWWSTVSFTQGNCSNIVEKYYTQRLAVIQRRQVPQNSNYSLGALYSFHLPHTNTLKYTSFLWNIFSSDSKDIRDDKSFLSWSLLLSIIPIQLLLTTSRTLATNTIMLANIEYTKYLLYYVANIVIIR